MSARIYDASAISLFRECPERARQRYWLNVVKDYDDDAALRGGKALHAGLDRWFASEGLEGALTTLRASWGTPEALIAPVNEKRPLGLYEALMRTYAEKWPRTGDNFSVVRNEEWVQATFGLLPGGNDSNVNTLALRPNHLAKTGAFTYGGILDRLIEMDGKRYVMDTKTTSGYLNDAYFARYVLSTQLRGYIALELVNGRECEGVFVDAVHVDTRSQKAEPKHLQRWGPHRYQPWQLSEWARDVEKTIRDIERLLAERGPNERWPQHDGACLSWNRLCAYYDRCSLAREVGDTLVGYRVDEWKPWERTTT